MPFTESHLERAAIDWFTSLGYDYVFGPYIEPEMEHAERSSFTEVLLHDPSRR